MAQAEAQVLDWIETIPRDEARKEIFRVQKSPITLSPKTQEINPPHDWLDDPLVALDRPRGPYTYEKAEFYLDTEPVELYNGWLVIDEMPTFDDKLFEGDLQGHMMGAARLSKFGKVLPDQMERAQEWVRPRGPNNRPCLMGSPELIIEVRSSSNSRPKDKMKRTRYFDNGAEIIWDIDEKSQTIYVYKVDSQDEPATYKVGDEIDCEPLLSGWRREVADLFNGDIPLEVMFSEVVEVSREEGRQEGEITAKRETLMQILAIKFGDLSDEITELITHTEEVAQLDQWVNETMQAESLDALFDLRDDT